MTQGVSKATGLKALADQLGIDATGSEWLAMAVGDSVSDLPFMALAESAFAPANADSEVRKAGVTVLKGPFQAGLLEATARLLGHRPGHCQTCRDPDLGSRSRLLLTLLSPPEQPSVRTKGTWAALALARLAWHLRAPDVRANGGSSSPIRKGSNVRGRSRRT
jgi:hypothetical protein